MNHLVYIAHSSPAVRSQAVYAALSALAWQGPFPLQIHVCTDVSDDFECLAGRCDVRVFSPGEIRSWSHPAGYVHRAKPALMRAFAREFPKDAVALADADTFFRCQVSVLFDRIGPRSAVMYEREYNVAERDSPMMHRFRRRLSRATFQGSPVEVDKDMWNSGVVGLGPDLFPVIDEWLAFLDEVYPQTRRWVLEQYALVYVLQLRRLAIQPAADVVTHYWYDKPGHLSVIEKFLAEARASGVDEVLPRLRANPIRIPKPPPRVHKPNLFQRVFGF